MLNILFLGELVGRPGIQALKNGLEEVKKRHQVDYTIINAEGMTNGFGIGKMHSQQLGKLGIDLATGGEKLFYKIDMVEFLPKAGFMLRGYNFPPQCPGRGMRFVELKGRKYLIANILGNADFPKIAVQNAFLAAENLLKKAEEEDASLLLVFHASTSAEKNTMFHFLDGKASAVVGTHTKVITADGQVSGKGTAYITDNGRVGAFTSVGGFEPETEINKIKGGIPLRSRECWTDGMIQGFLVTLDEETGKAVGCATILERIEISKPEDKK